jgi:hypothetical protein
MLSDTPSLEGCEAKFGRAKTHAEELRSEITTVLDKNMHTLRPERDEDARQYVFYVEEMPSSSEDWGLVFGDAVHNFRATLDHLVVQLAILSQGRVLTEEEIRSAEFPVLHEPGRWEKISGPSAVKLLRAGERERIRELQPFNASDRSIWGREAIFGGGARAPRLIEVLHRVDIEDKHRFVHPSWYAVRTIELPSLPGINRAMANGDRLERDAEVGRWGFEDALPDLPPDLDVNRYFPLEVASMESISGYSMLDFLSEVEALISALMELFRPPLTSGDPAPPVTAIPDLAAAYKQSLI